MSVVEDVPFYVDEAIRSGGPVLELGVGTGRIAVPIAAAGVEIVGVDVSAGMLEVARERADLAGVDVDLRQGDLRDPPVDESSHWSSDPFRSLLHMETETDRRLALRAVSRCLARTGPLRLRRLHAVRGGHRRDARPLARARAGDLGARRLGRGARGR